MQYLVKNTTPLLAHDGSYTGSKTIWIEGSAGANAFPLGPQETCAVSDTALSLLQQNFSDIIQVMGTTLDDEGPVAKVITLSATWTSYTLGKYCTHFQFNTTATDCLISFTDQTVSQPDFAVPVPANPAAPGGQLFTLDMNMNPAKTIWVKGTGTLTIIGL